MSVSMNECLVGSVQLMRRFVARFLFSPATARFVPLRGKV